MAGISGEVLRGESSANLQSVLGDLEAPRMSFESAMHGAGASLANMAQELLKKFQTPVKPENSSSISTLPKLDLFSRQAFDFSPKPKAEPFFFPEAKPFQFTPSRSALQFKDSRNPNMAMGNPSNATDNPVMSNNYLVVRDQYVLSYNNDKKTPNWVSWQLNEDWLGSQKRTGTFIPDDSLPSGFNRAQHSDYSRSGYDRGHNTPSADRTASREDNEATFIMTNIAPQAPDNNQGPWEKLESYSREMARQGKELYIISGADGSKGTIGNGVNVPESWWKVIVILPQKGQGVTDVKANTEVIAVEIPNENGMKNDDWRKYVTTVHAIERHTGYDLLSELPDDIEHKVSSTKFPK